MIPKQPYNQIPQFQASKWLTLPLLLTPGEMLSLLTLLPEWIAPLSGIIPEEEAIIPKPLFLELYSNYAKEIELGTKRPFIDPRLTCVFTDMLDKLRAISTPQGLIIRVIRPALFVQPYMLHYSKETGKFVDATHSLDSFAWGLVFSTPLLFRNPETQQVEKNRDPYFQKIQKWARTHTVPTPFLVEGKIINFPARISKTRETPICMLK